MAKALENWFKHVSGKKDSEHAILLIEQLGLEGYGIYWVLMETLRSSESYSYPMELLPALARRYNTSEAKIVAVITKYGLFLVTDDNRFYSPELNADMGAYDRILEQRRLAGASGGKSKAEKANGSKSQAGGEQESSGCVANANQEPTKSQPNDNQDAGKVVPSSVQYSRGDSSSVDISKKEKKKKSGDEGIDDREKAFASLPQTFHNSQFKDEAVKFAFWYRDNMSPGTVKVTWSMIAQWALVWYHLRVTDKRQDKDFLKTVIVWARGHEFWSVNFLSPTKLREKDDQGQMYIDRFISEFEREKKKGEKKQVADRPAFAIRDQIMDEPYKWASVIREGRENEEWFATLEDVKKFGLRIRVSSCQSTP